MVFIKQTYQLNLNMYENHIISDFVPLEVSPFYMRYYDLDIWFPLMLRRYVECRAH